VRELRAQTALEQSAQLVHVDAVGLERHRVDLGAALAQRQERAVVRRLLDDDGVALGDERVEEERVSLHGPVRDDDLLGRHAVALGEPRAQRHVADGGAVAGDAGGVVGERALRGVLEPVDVDDVEGRGAAGEGDRVVGGHRLRE